MLRRMLLAASRSATLQSATSRTPVARRVVRRFVAGETLEEALDVSRQLTRDGFLVTLDHLGEAVRDPADARAALDAYEELAGRAADEAIDASISVKLTHLGLAVSERLCHQLISSVSAAARDAGMDVTVDMEGSALTDITLDLVARLRREGHDHVGCAVQAYLMRSPDDVRRLTATGASLRVCKGAYVEPAPIAHQQRSVIRSAFLDLVEIVLDSGTYGRFATHDEALIRQIQQRGGPADGRYEFQMLYGVREPLQHELVGAGFPLRIYVPYGREWYPYFLRRLAERPANLAFFLRALAGRRQT